MQGREVRLRDADSKDTALEPLDAANGSSAGKVSVRTCTANLVLSILGPGQLMLPFCLMELGVTVGTCLLASFALFSVWSMFVLATCAKQVAASSYFELITLLLGKRARSLLDVLILGYIWGGNIAFFSIVKQQLGFLASNTGADDMGVALLAVAVLCVVWPLSMLRELGRLKFTSVLGCSAALWITVVVALSSPWASGRFEFCDGIGGVAPVQEVPLSFLKVASATPLVAFAFNGSWSFLTVYNTLDRPTPRRTGIFIACSLGMLSCDYFVISLFGYLSYCGGTNSNILDSLEGQEGWRKISVIVARAALVLQLCLSMPVRFNVASSVLVPPPAMMAQKNHFLLTTALLFTSAGIAATAIPFHVALGVTSAICATTIMYIFPALFEVQLLRRACSEGNSISVALRACCTALVGCVGLFTLVAGTYANLRQIWTAD